MSFVAGLRRLGRHRLFRQLLVVRVAIQGADGLLQVALASFVLFSPERQPDAASIARMDQPARPAVLIFPRFGEAFATREMLPSEAFVRLTQASTNYVNLGENGFTALTNFVRQVPAIAVDYPDGDAGVRAVEELCATR